MKNMHKQSRSRIGLHDAFCGFPYDEALAHRVQAWQSYLEKFWWEDLVHTTLPIPSGCGDIYELAHPFDNTNESFAIADMRRIKVSSPHYHTDETEIYIILQGVGIVVVGGREIAVQRGSVVITPPNIAHFTVVKRDLVIAVINSPPFNYEHSIAMSKTSVRYGFYKEQFDRLCAQK